jgi:serine acetyltransferase
LEVLLCYPGLHALWVYRIAHCLEKWGIPVSYTHLRAHET